MTAKLSTGLRNAMLATGSFKATMEPAQLKIYSGAVPADADASVGSATLLTTITEDATGTGLDFDVAAVAGVLAKDPAQIWRGVNVAGGAATFFRLVAAGDDGTSSTTQPRAQGTVGAAGADLNLSNPTLISGASQTIDAFNVALPTA